MGKIRIGVATFTIKKESSELVATRSTLKINPFLYNNNL